MKQCNKCKTVLEESGFYKDKTKKDGLSTCCIGCRKQWKLNNKEHISEYNKIYEHEEDHLEKSRIRKRASKARKPEYYAKLYKDWIKANPDKVKASKDRDYAKNTNSYILRAQLRRVRVKGLRADYTNDQWLKAVEFFGGECAYCGEVTEMTHEHVVPVVKFGEYTNGNIVPACARCNGSKHTEDMEIWYSAQEFFSEDKLFLIKYFLHVCQSEVKVS